MCARRFCKHGAGGGGDGDVGLGGAVLEGELVVVLIVVGKNLVALLVNNSVMILDLLGEYYRLWVHLHAPRPLPWRILVGPIFLLTQPAVVVALLLFGDLGLAFLCEVYISACW